MPLRGKLPSSHYRVLVSRSEDRPRAALFPFSLRERLPSFRLPLREGDEEPVIDLRAALDAVYRDAALDLRVDYRAEPVPALAAEDAACAGSCSARRAGERWRRRATAPRPCEQLGPRSAAEAAPQA